MQVVADKLADWATHESDDNAADAFGRSAFNRYYYASYLMTREMLSELNNKWAREGHKKIPDLLEGKVIKKIRNELKKKQRAGLLGREQAERFRRSANSAVSDLSNLLKTAYNSRVIADYQPEIRIIRDRRQISLGNEKLGAAQNWAKNVSRYKGSILYVCEQLGLT
jgi:hypothetical protein